MGFVSFGHAEQNKYRGRTTIFAEASISQVGDFLRAKDWAQTEREENETPGSKIFDYSTAKHEVEVRVDTSKCQEKGGMAEVWITFNNTMHRDGMGRAVKIFGLLDPDRYEKESDFVVFDESKQDKHAQQAATMRKEHNINDAECVVGRTFEATISGGKIPCDNKLHRGRIWIAPQPKGKDLSSSAISNSYELSWEARTNGVPKESEVNFRFNVSPTLAEMKKYLVPNVGKFIKIPVKPKVQMGTAHDPHCGANVVSVPEIVTLEPYGIFKTYLDEPRAKDKAAAAPAKTLISEDDRHSE